MVDAAKWGFLRTFILENGHIKVWGKRQKQRLVQLGERAREALKRYLTLRGSNTTEKLWLNEAGAQLVRLVFRR